ncbi:sugar nucleotide-binding protein, partial [Suipraeoptans intestinalis]|uniref:sugar nucleotide-binding protein n=1 Tax=Suipraeoptans intestinalis TaxID=2606628 RepID=UPI0023EFE496
MKVLVTGVAGQLGHDVMNELAARGIEGIGSDIRETYSGVEDGTAVTRMPYVQMDITEERSVQKVLSEAAPDVVVHCAAWTAVDAAEEEANREIVYKVNVLGTKHIASACKVLGCKMVYISTD